MNGGPTIEAITTDIGGGLVGIWETARQCKANTIRLSNRGRRSGRIWLRWGNFKAGSKKIRLLFEGLGIALGKRTGIAPSFASIFTGAWRDLPGRRWRRTC